MEDNPDKKDPSLEIEISDDDILEAMKDISGYLDITPADLKELYKLTYRHAHDRIMKSVKARDIMTREVVTVRRTTPLMEVAEIMGSRGISGVPVLEDNGALAGVISGKDFLASMGAKENMNFMSVIAECIKCGGCVTVAISGKKAEDLMKAPAITVDEGTTAADIAGIFSARKINRVPVTDSHGRLVGIVSRADIVRASTIRLRA
ncbi:MAG: CBS domain-containing protein [Nitrospirae bacterium]|nr:CBS domain-containing protein [Nitrospirota bacterium]